MAQRIGPASTSVAAIARLLGALFVAVPSLVAAQSAQPDSTAKTGRGARTPPPSSADSLVIPPPVTKTGCATIDIQLHGVSDATATEAPGMSCGPIAPVVVGTPVFDASRLIVRFAIALRNAGDDQLHAPAWLTTQLDTGVTTPAVRWSYDTLLHSPSGPRLAAADGSIVLPPGITSAVQLIELPIPAGATGIRLSLKAFGTYVLSVPARPPDTVSLDELQQSRLAENLITGDRHIPERTVRNRLWLLFRSGATPEQRQAVIEAINGTVVGGAIRTTGNGYPPPHGMHTLRYYYVAFPAYPDSGAVPLERAIHTLAPMPQVQEVQPDVLGHG